MSQVFLNRMKVELNLLLNQPPHGIAAYPKSEDRIDVLEAKIQGTSGTPYENGEFVLEITMPDKYPLHPPNVRFITKIYHPNIDSGGRICLDLLNMPPKGGWKPSINISTLLASIKLLMDEPNADDGLMADITEQYRNNKPLFEKIAREWTKKYAMVSTLIDNSTATEEQPSNSSSNNNTKQQASHKRTTKPSSKSDSDSSSDEDSSDSDSSDSEPSSSKHKRKKL